MERAQKVSEEKELELFTRDCGSKIDLLNMQWIYRSKKHFHLKEADIYSLLIPIHYRVSVEQVKAMVEASDVDEFLLCFRKHLMQDIMISDRN